MRALIFVALLPACAHKAWTTRDVGEPELWSALAEPSLEGAIEILKDEPDLLTVSITVTAVQETQHAEHQQVARYQRYERGPARSLPWFGAAATAGLAGAWLTYGERRLSVQELSATGGTDGVSSGLRVTSDSAPMAPPAVGISLLSGAGGLALGGTLQLLSPLAPPMDRTVSRREKPLPSTWAHTPFAGSEVTLRFSSGTEVWRGQTDAGGNATLDIRLPESGGLPNAVSTTGPGASTVDGASLDLTSTLAWGSVVAARTTAALAAGDLASARTLVATAPPRSPAEALAAGAWCTSTAPLAAEAALRGALSELTPLLIPAPPGGACTAAWTASRAAVAGHAARAVVRGDLDPAEGWAALLRQDPASPDTEQLDADITALRERLAEAEARTEEERAARDERDAAAEEQRRAASWRGRVAAGLAACDRYHAELARRKRIIYTMQKNFDSRIQEQVAALEPWLEAQQDGDFGRKLEDLVTVESEMRSAGGATDLLREELIRQTAVHCED